MQTGMICNCKQVSYADVENALHQMTSFSDVLEAFDEVQKVTHCGCHFRNHDEIAGKGKFVLVHKSRIGIDLHKKNQFRSCFYFPEEMLLIFLSKIITKLLRNIY